MIEIVIPDSVKLQCFNAVFARAVGGQSAVEMLLQFYAESMSYEDIGKLHGGIPKSTVRDTIQRGTEAIRDMGIWPTNWTKRRGRVRASNN